MLKLGDAGGLLTNLVVEVVQDFVHQQSQLKMGIHETIHVFPLSEVPRAQHMQRSARGVLRCSSATSSSTCACKCAANAGMTQFTGASLHQSEKTVIHDIRDSFFHGVAMDTAHVCTSCASRVHHVCTCVCTYVCTCVSPHFLLALKKHIFIS